MSYDDRFVREADVGKVDYTDKVWEVRLATMAAVPTGLSVWERQVLIADAVRGQGAPKTKRIRLNVMVNDPEDAAAVKRVSQALFLDEDAELPF
ncbi:MULTISPECIES: hypothetical protein [unclassified Roseateles]|uniref:hypothetical protein n=1 Tax=unclassified Roseateles TaxID=2626991 RepID=UPI0006F4F066|nr:MULTISPECIES: hypothetical protein [unclassified Roseateles]KQW43288.1 hypothetical protein ASC81_15955 [Pelomonas sp. Root405]KRA71026.1 hypothetical protein ASD88_14480 [Pelomonas sp. Root662]